MLCKMRQVLLFLILLQAALADKKNDDDDNNDISTWCMTGVVLILVALLFTYWCYTLDATSMPPRYGELHVIIDKPVVVSREDLAGVA
jgi:hypothetical protein